VFIALSVGQVYFNFEVLKDAAARLDRSEEEMLVTMLANEGLHLITNPVTYTRFSPEEADKEYEKMRDSPAQSIPSENTVIQIAVAEVASEMIGQTIARQLEDPNYKITEESLSSDNRDYVNTRDALVLEAVRRVYGIKARTQEEIENLTPDEAMVIQRMRAYVNAGAIESNIKPLFQALQLMDKENR